MTDLTTIEQATGAKLEAGREYESIAKAMHEAYERLADKYHYHTRPESAVPWEQLSENHHYLMVAAVTEAVRPALAERDALIMRLAGLLTSPAPHGMELVRRAEQAEADLTAMTAERERFRRYVETDVIMQAYSERDRWAMFKALARYQPAEEEEKMTKNEGSYLAAVAKGMVSKFAQDYVEELTAERDASRRIIMAAMVQMQKETEAWQGRWKA